MTSLRHQRIVLSITLADVLAHSRIPILAAVFGIFSWFGKVAIAFLDARIFRAMGKLAFERRLAVLVATLALYRAFPYIVVLMWHVGLLGRGDGVLSGTGCVRHMTLRSSGEHCSGEAGLVRLDFF